MKNRPSGPEPDAGVRVAAWGASFGVQRRHIRKLRPLAPAGAESEEGRRGSWCVELIRHRSRQCGLKPTVARKVPPAVPGHEAPLATGGFSASTWPSAPARIGGRAGRHVGIIFRSRASRRDARAARGQRPVARRTRRCGDRHLAEVLRGRSRAAPEPHPWRLVARQLGHAGRRHTGDLRPGGVVLGCRGRARDDGALRRPAARLLGRLS
jgi:hypothetical protein